MNVTAEPLLHPVKLVDIRPTQMTVGMGEVLRKRASWRDGAERDKAEYLGRHMIPVVIGPKRRYHMIDHHHLARALYEEGTRHVLVLVKANLHHLSHSAFETYMDNRNWLHPYDAQGQRCAYSEMPKHIGKLADDPYRTLAGALREVGGYAKSDVPYAEFLWADFLRRKIARSMVKKALEEATAKALALARTMEASYLPGWAGYHR